MTSRYKEADRGRFECYLIDRWHNVAVAYTDYDVVKLAKGYTEEHHKAVEEFAEEYGMTVEWGNKG